MTGFATTRRGALLGAAGLLAAPAISYGQQPRTLRLNHTDTDIGARQEAANLFARRVQELTDGRFRVQVFHSGQLANDARSVCSPVQDPEQRSDVVAAKLNVEVTERNVRSSSASPPNTTTRSECFFPLCPCAWISCANALGVWFSTVTPSSQIRR